MENETGLESLTARFAGIGRIYGEEGLIRLSQSHVAVVGVGGVGSWVVESLARTGVGEITMIDPDDICISKVNRQLPSLSNTIGRPKVDVLKERLLLINPHLKVNMITDWFTSQTSKEILVPGYDFVVDAIDSLSNKALLLASCIQKNMNVVTIGGAGGKTDPTKIKICDLKDTTVDPLLKQVRKRLRNTYGMNGIVNYGIFAVYSNEQPIFPDTCGTKKPLKLDCGDGYGSSSFVTGSFGFAAASLVVNQLTRWRPK
jgi:tRNA A37 threonylcarbamoyladenosine dehydratase